MPAVLRNITFDPAAFASATSTPVDSAGVVRFRRKHGFLSGGQWVEPGKHDAAYANGAFTTPVNLAVPDTGAAIYSVMVSSETHTIGLSAGASVDLATLLLVGDVEDVSAVQQLLDTKQDALGPPADDGYTLYADIEGDPYWGPPTSGGVTQQELTDGLATKENVGVAAGLVATETTNRTNADATLLTNINTRLTQAQADALYASLASLAAYAQLAVAQTFTKAQTVKGEAANEATEILTIRDSANAIILRVKKSSGYGVARLSLAAGGTANEPALEISNLPQGMTEQRTFAIGGTHQMFMDGNGILELMTNHVRAWRVSASAYSSASAPSFLMQEQSRSGVDHLVLFPSAATTKALAFRRPTSTSDAIAGRLDVAWSDTTHATRTSAGSLTLVKAAVDVTPLAYDTQDSATQTGILVLHNGAQKRVKIGAADSGGAGQRLLTIDN